MYTGDPTRDEQRHRLLRDQLEIYREHGASWSLWTYKDIGLQGLVHAAADSPYLQRIAPVVAKKARLGVDAWGSVDADVRYILDPVERAFREEFPNFSPYPWGAKRWIDRLVRSILLAEPLIDEFGRCFEGVGPGEAETLADSFRLDRCTRRDELLKIIRSDSAPTGRQPA